MQASSAELAAAIVAAVHNVDYRQPGVLMDRFVRDTDLGGLAALRKALNEDDAPAARRP